MKITIEFETNDLGQLTTVLTAIHGTAALQIRGVGDPVSVKVDDPISTSTSPAPRTASNPTGQQYYSDASFAKNLPVWEKLIRSGKKTPADVIATVSSTASLSDEQKNIILAIKKAGPVPFQHVANQIIAANGPAELKAAAALIASVANEMERAELDDLVRERTDEMAGPI